MAGLLSVASKDPYLQSRINRFDKWQNAAREALRRPGVKAKLGELGTHLYNLNENVFLPDVRDSVVSVPRNQRDTDNVAVLPSYGNYNLRPDTSLLKPIPSRRKVIASAMAQAGLKPSRRAVNKYIDTTIATLTDESKKALLSLENSGNAHASCSAGDNEHNIFIPSRTIIVFSHELHIAYKGGTMAHELTHAHDQKQLTVRPDIVDSVRTELRGYYVGNIIAEDAIEAGELKREDYESRDPDTNAMMAIIREHDIDSDELLRPETGPITNEDAAGFSMLLQGLIEL